MLISRIEKLSEIPEQKFVKDVKYPNAECIETCL